MDSTKRQINRMVATARRRAALTLVVFHASGLVLVALVAVAALWAIVGLSTDRLLRTASGVIGLALVAAILTAWRHMPSRRGVAAGIDRALGLEQRLETVVDGLDESDAVAGLLRRDTLSRIRDVDLDRLYPFELAWRSRAIWGLALAVLVAGAVVRLYAPGAGAGSARPWRAVSTGAVESAGESAETDRGRPDESQRGVPSAPQGEAPPAAAPALEPDTKETAPAPPQPPSRERRQGSEGEPSTPGETAREIVPAESEPAGANRAADGEDDRPAAGASDAPGAQDPLEERGAATATETDAPASAAEGAPSTAELGALDRAQLERYLPQIQEYRQVAEAILARESLPPALERYIRDYFNAIQPEQP